MRGVVAVLLTLTALTQAPAPAGPPHAASDTLSRFRLDPGFRIELMASEPDIQSAGRRWTSTSAAAGSSWRCRGIPWTRGRPGA